MTCLLIGILAFIVQRSLCGYGKRLLPKLIPAVIAALLWIYAGLRFFGVISFADDMSGIYEGGLVSSIWWGLTAISLLIGILLAWCIHLMNRFRKFESE